MGRRTDIDGQLDFFNEINEYKDDCGATVKVNNPITTIKERKSATKRLVISDGVPNNDVYTQQEFRFSMQTIEIEHTDGENVSDTSENESVKQKETGKAKTPEYVGNQSGDSKETSESQTPEYVGTVTDDFRKTNEADAPENIEAYKVKPNETENSGADGLLYDSCVRCWCSDCKHNARNEGKPRDMCGVMMPCPACDGCVSQGYAEICEIGSAKEGCMTRALEEGIYSDDYE